MAEATAPRRCAECGAPLESPIGCFDCHSIFPAETALTHFERLGLPTRFAIDNNQLEEHYLKWSRELHPDYFQLRPPEDQQLSLSLSASLNDAYMTLKDPFRRAEYLLWLFGGPAANELRAMPEGFLEQVLELRAEIDELVEQEGQDSPCAATLRDRLVHERNQAMEKVAAIFESIEQGGSARPDTEAMARARRQLNTVKYYDGLLRELNR